MLRALIACIAVGALFGACSGNDDATSTAETSGPKATVAAEEGAVLGAITIPSSGARDDSAVGSCTGAGGYSDIREGAAVTVRDGSGDVIATGRLEGGVVEGSLCIHVFQVDVPRADFYSFEVSNRGELTYSYQDMVDAEWQVALSLGD